MMWDSAPAPERQPVTWTNDDLMNPQARRAAALVSTWYGVSVGGGTWRPQHDALAMKVYQRLVAGIDVRDIEPARSRRQAPPPIDPRTWSNLS